jgi:hypothetical protein
MNLVSPKKSPLAISSSAISLKDAEHVSLPEFNGAVLDLDGTLIDSVYQRVLSWQEAFAEMGYYIPAWELHRHIGMCADLLIDALSRMLGTSQFSVLEQRQALDMVVLLVAMQLRCVPCQAHANCWTAWLRQGNTLHLRLAEIEPGHKSAWLSWTGPLRYR